MTFPESSAQRETHHTRDKTSRVNSSWNIMASLDNVIKERNNNSVNSTSKYYMKNFHFPIRIQQNRSAIEPRLRLADGVIGIYQYRDQWFYRQRICLLLNRSSFFRLLPNTQRVTDMSFSSTLLEVLHCKLFLTTMISLVVFKHGMFLSRLLQSTGI